MNPRLHRWTPAVLLVIAGSTHSLAAGPFGAVIELSALSGADGFVLNGATVSEQSGFLVSNAGDVNDDGVDDLIIGAPNTNTNGASSGKCYVVFGGAGIGASGSLNLSTLNGTNGFVCQGLDAFDRTGWSAAGAGDVNGDMVDDIVIGAFGGDPNGMSSGETYIIFGGAGVGASGSVNLASLNGTNGFVCNGDGASDQSGFSVSSAGDINGDGFDDVLIGVYSDYYAVDGGKCYVVFGGAAVGAGGSLDLSTLNGANGFVCLGIDVKDYCGNSVSAAGDVNGDGMDDIIIGAKGADPNGNFSGESYVVFGAMGVGAGGTLNMSALNGANGFTCNGANSGWRSGASVSCAGDVNGDMIDDLIIGAPNGGPGRSYVVFGSVGIGASGTLELAALSGPDGFVCNGVDANDRSGSAVSGAGDINGDGVMDLIIGAYQADPNGNASGESYVVFGGAGIGSGGALSLSNLTGTNGFVCNGIDGNDYSGRTVSAAGDFNGDGVDDLIIGAPGGDPIGSAAAGESFVIFGCDTFVLIGDLNGDCVVDTADLGLLLGNFGGVCPP
ncbi:MAG: FG-GAP repeat protein [Phycisphaeraceae bacterium]|nr:FG-GAP repeat protein [Phycisphaeraceae bacterium]MCB9847991.1 FG-GAP repeat protein [Phycisphaeraceae bacterium]